VSDEAAAASKETTAGMAAVGAGQARRTLTLGDYVGGRDNNFNLIRFLAASAVLLSHSFPLSNGDPTTEPLRSWLGLSAGEIAVDVFFLTSGFLVAGSLLTRHSVSGFAVARALRIYPAMVVSVLLTVPVVGL
jgi:peptidoglycan/LPS O-acetylase OafA/YrhL